MRVGGDGNEAIFSDLAGDLEAFGERHRKQFWRIVESFIETPRLAGPALWASPVDAVTVRHVVVAGVLSLKSLSPARVSVAAVLAVVMAEAPEADVLPDGADREALALLWSLAATWALAVDYGDGTGDE